MTLFKELSRAVGHLAVTIVMAGALPTCAEQLLADPAAMFHAGERHDFVGANQFSLQIVENHRYLQSTPKRSASAIYIPVTAELGDLHKVRWRWRVDPLHKSADIRQIAKEDVGATIMFVFGEPTVLNRDVPTLAYVWSSTPVDNGTVLPSLRLKYLRYVQLRGLREAGHWSSEVRDVADDYRNAFGQTPDKLKYVVVFNDNDQTGEPVSAMFGAIFTGP